MNWSGVPVVHLRPTVFVDNPLFTVFGTVSVRERDILALPFGRGHTSPIAASDVARVASTVLLDPAQHNGAVYELTGPDVLRLHRQDRYNRRTDDVEQITGQPAQTVAHYIAAHPNEFG